LVKVNVFLILPRASAFTFKYRKTTKKFKNLTTNLTNYTNGAAPPWFLYRVFTRTARGIRVKSGISKYEFVRFVAFVRADLRSVVVNFSSRK
jgi:cytochrome bd-type quinol oxidase subunit 2